MSENLICFEHGITFKLVFGWTGHDGLMHKLIKTLSALSTNEINDFTSYIMNERLTSASASKKLPTIIIRNLSKRLKGRGIFATKKRGQRKQNKK
jgi:hypothetical protein